MRAVWLRVGYWAGGLVAIAAVAGAFAAGSAGPILLLLGWGLLGALGEVVASLRPRQEPRLPSNPRPADGEVGVARMEGVDGAPNPVDPRFRRFAREEFPAADSPTVERDLRRAPRLLGRVVWVSLFVGRDGRNWSDDEIARAHAAIVKAGVWIEREAIRWNAPVNIELADVYFVADDHEPDEVEITFVPEGDAHGPIEARATTKALIAMSRAAALLGFRDAHDLIGRINPRLNADAVVWLFHPRRAGRSIAVPIDDAEMAGVSLAVCYAREANFPEPLPLRRSPITDPVTVVHELLHLFGATDKYGAPLDSFPPRSVTSRDVMRLSREDLARLRIDPGTAWEIGWATPGAGKANGRRDS